MEINIVINYGLTLLLVILALQSSVDISLLFFVEVSEQNIFIR
jgi:hypothetical protein